MDAIKIILENQLTADNAVTLVELLADYDELIRQMTVYVLAGKAGDSDSRKDLLGDYYDDVQTKVNWTIKTAEEVWAGVYGDDDVRRQKLGADYDLVMFRVNQTVSEHTKIYMPTNPTYTKDLGGKRYVMKDVQTAMGVRDWYGYGQRNQGDNPYVFYGSGCGFMSFYACIATIKGYGLTPLEYANKNLKAVGGTKCPISLSVGLRLLDKEGIKYTWLKTFSVAAVREAMLTHLWKGNPVIISLSYKNNQGNGTIDKRYTNYAHYAVVNYASADGQTCYLWDSGAKLPRKVNLLDLCGHIPQCTNSTIKFDDLWNGWQNCGGVVLVNMA